MFGNFVVGVDGSKRSDRANRIAYDLAKRGQIRPTIVGIETRSILD